MIFKQIDAILRRQKRQTRRVKFPYELARQLHKHGWAYPRAKVSVCVGLEWRWGNLPWSDWLLVDPITNVDIADANRILAEHVITLPVQPGRRKQSVGRIRITKIRRERLGDISEDDCWAEGIPLGWTFDEVQGIPFDCYDCPLCHRRYYEGYLDAYACLWNHVYGKGAWDRMKDDDVWILDFELVEGL